MEGSSSMKTARRGRRLRGAACRAWVLLAAAALLAASCTPAQSPSGSDRSTGPGPGPSVRPLNIGLLSEPAALGSKFAGGGTGNADYSFLFSAKLAQYDAMGTPTPVLLARLPSLDDGSWNAFPDGSMEVTYQLQPEARWHDGTPFTAADVVFTYQAIMNPSLAVTNREPERFIESVEALDRHTLFVRWKEAYVFANVWDLEPLPRHVFGPLLQRDPLAFANATAWNRDWVGLGPYQLAEWEQGAYLRGRAWPEFVLGAPRIRDIVIHFLTDENQVVAQMLAGRIDLTLGNALRLEEGVILREQMEARGEASVMTIPTKIRYGELQYRDPRPPPSRDVRVRQGLMHAADRQVLVDALLQGVTTVAHMYLSPNDPAFAPASRVIRTYPFDPNRAQALWREAGWTRGPDGGLRSPTGERFELEIRTTEGTQNLKEAQVLADFWSQAGISATVDVIPRAKQNDQEYRARFPGLTTSATSIGPTWLEKWQSSLIANEANGWRGGNRGAYSRPEFDQMYRVYITTLDTSQRTERLVQLVSFASEDVTYLPLYYQVDVHAIRTGLKGLEPRWPGQAGMAFNAHRWYWE